MNIEKWLEDQSMKDLNEWERKNRAYEDLKEHASDNEYLYYINLKLRHANDLMHVLNTLLTVMAVLLTIVTLKYLGFF